MSGSTTLCNELVIGCLVRDRAGKVCHLDGNYDGRIDVGESAWSSLQLWQDANSDGIADSGELNTLAALGIQSLATAYTTTATTDSYGNQHRQQGSFTRTDGSTALVEDLWLRSNPSSTRQENPLDNEQFGLLRQKGCTNGKRKSFAYLDDPGARQAARDQLRRIM